MAVLADQIKVYVYSRDPLAECGLQAHLDAAAGVDIHTCPSVADVAVLAWPSFDETLSAKLDQLATSGCSTTVLVLSHLDVDDLPHLAAASVSGVLRATEVTPERLQHAVEAAARGGGSLPPDIIGHLLRSSAGNGTARSTRAHGRNVRLSSREQAVLKLVAEGLDTAQIAESLHYSERTIKGTIHDVVRRFALRNRPHAVAWAMRHELI